MVNSLILSYLWSGHPLALLATASALLLTALWLLWTFRGGGKKTDSDSSGVEDVGTPRVLKVFYATQTGSAKAFAEQLAGEARVAGVQTSLADLKDCDPEDTLTQEVSRQPDLEFHLVKKCVAVACS